MYNILYYDALCMCAILIWCGIYYLIYIKYYVLHVYTCISCVHHVLYYKCMYNVTFDAL